jgi:hypothetical protein
MGSNVRINKTREVLRNTPEGLTVLQIAEAAGTDKSHISRIVRSMPDAYIDRWIKNGQRVSAVWCVVIPPDNCPRPDSRRKKAK